MVEKENYIPVSEERLTNLDVLVNENGMEGLIVQYNGVPVDRLHDYFRLNEGAKHFTLKFFPNNHNVKNTFKDSYGKIVDSEDYDAVFYSYDATSEEELRDRIIFLASCCKNQDLNINMTAHLGNQEFLIVSDKDDFEYINSDRGTKGFSKEQVENLMEAVRSKSSQNNR